MAEPGGWRRFLTTPFRTFRTKINLVPKAPKISISFDYLYTFFPSLSFSQYNIQLLPAPTFGYNSFKLSQRRSATR
jgi:hypothetical protein